jgi:hypothetical protein
MKLGSMNRIIIFSSSFFLLAGQAHADNSHGSTSPLMLAIKPQEGQLNTSLAVVRDWGLIHIQMKELATNLYLEATRTDPSLTDSSAIKTPQMIPTPGKIQSQEYLAPRTEWVAYYLNSMEPLMQFITKSLRASEGGKLQFVVPKGTTSELSQIANTLQNIGHKLDKSLDRVDAIFNEDQPSSAELQEVALRIYDETSQLEDARCHYYDVLRAALKNGVKETEILPTSAQQNSK